LFGEAIQLIDKVIAVIAPDESLNTLSLKADLLQCASNLFNALANPVGGVVPGALLTAPRDENSFCTRLEGAQNVVGLHFGYTEHWHNPDAGLGPPPNPCQSTGAEETVLATEADDDRLGFRFRHRPEYMVQLFSDLSSVVWLSQDYCLRRALGNTYTAGLALVRRYLDCTAGINVGHVIWTDTYAGQAGSAFVLEQDLRAYAAPQTPSSFVGSAFPVIGELYRSKVLCPCFRRKCRWLKSADSPYRFYCFGQ